METIDLLFRNKYFNLYYHPIYTYVKKSLNVCIFIFVYINVKCLKLFRHNKQFNFLQSIFVLLKIPLFFLLV